MSFDLEVYFLSANGTAFAEFPERRFSEPDVSDMSLRMSLVYSHATFEAIESERDVICIDLHNAGRMDDVTIIVSADVVPT